MLKIGLYLANDSDEFPKQAGEWAEQTGATCFPMRGIGDLIGHAPGLLDGSVSHLAIFCHGTPRALGRPGRWGVDLRPARWTQPEFIGPEQFAASWASKLSDDALVSLCACLCGRSQHWYLTTVLGKLYGKSLSPWGQESYENGGVTSLAMHLTRALAKWSGQRVRVRAHCAAGHTTYQALLRQFRLGQDVGTSLFRSVVGPGVDWTIALRNRWQAVVKGERAERWLLGDESVVMEIRELMR